MNFSDLSAEFLRMVGTDSHQLDSPINSLRWKITFSIVFGKYFTFLDFFKGEFLDVGTFIFILVCVTFLVSILHSRIDPILDPVLPPSEMALLSFLTPNLFSDVDIEWSPKWPFVLSTFVKCRFFYQSFTCCSFDFGRGGKRNKLRADSPDILRRRYDPLVYLIFMTGNHDRIFWALPSNFIQESSLIVPFSHMLTVRNVNFWQPLPTCREWWLSDQKLIISSPDLASVGRQGARDDAGSISARHQVFTIIAIPIITITIITITTTMSRTTVLPVQQCAVLSARTMRAVTTLLFLQVIFMLITFIQAVLCVNIYLRFFKLISSDGWVGLVPRPPPPPRQRVKALCQGKGLEKGLCHGKSQEKGLCKSLEKGCKGQEKLSAQCSGAKTRGAGTPGFSCSSSREAEDLIV